MKRYLVLIFLFFTHHHVCADAAQGFTINILDYDYKVHKVIYVHLPAKTTDRGMIFVFRGNLIWGSIDGKRGYHSTLVSERGSAIEPEEEFSIDGDLLENIAELYNGLDFNQLSKPQNIRMTSTGPTGVNWTFQDSVQRKMRISRRKLFSEEFEHEHERLISLIETIWGVTKLDRTLLRR